MQRPGETYATVSMAADGHSDDRARWLLLLTSGKATSELTFLGKCQTMQNCEAVCSNKVFLRMVCMMVRETGGNATDYLSLCCRLTDLYFNLICSLICDADSSSNSQV